MASVKKAPPLVDYRAMNAQFCDDMQYCGWTQPANEDEVQFTALASMCLSPPCASRMTMWEASSVLVCLQAFPVMRW
jgi:hypothetical protein